MTLRECFVQYKDMVEEAEQLEKETRKAGRVTDTVKGSESEPPYLKRTFTISGVDQKKNESRIKRINVLRSRMADVEKTIEELDNSMIKLALKLKYIDGMTWRDVAQRIGKDKDGIRMAVKRFFEKNI